MELRPCSGRARRRQSATLSLSYPRLRQLGRWALLGGAAAAVEYALLRLLVEVLAVPSWLAAPLAAEALIVARFLVADRWVFGHRRPALVRLVRYQGACMGALVVYLVVFNGLVLLGLDYRLAFVGGTGASFAWSLATNFLWVWKADALATPRLQ
jgi:putative flippase GtrA